MVKHGRTTKEIREERLATDPAFRERWDRTAVARAVANVLIQHRGERGWSQTRLAKELGISQSQVARLESGEHNPSLDTLYLITSALGLRLTHTIEPPISPTIDRKPTILAENPVRTILAEETSSTGRVRFEIAV